MTDSCLLWPLSVMKSLFGGINKQNLMFLVSLNCFLALCVKKKLVPHNRLGRGSAVGIAIRYGLNGLQIESR